MDIHLKKCRNVLPFCYSESLTFIYTKITTVNVLIQKRFIKGYFFSRVITNMSSELNGLYKDIHSFAFTSAKLTHKLHKRKTKQKKDKTQIVIWPNEHFFHIMVGVKLKSGETSSIHLHECALVKINQICVSRLFCK